jgi:two-component system, OmpR family, alkaline phosphatase synthesis response regulator PhoP
MPSPAARLLYVEDHSDTLEFVSFVLREDGFEVVTVADPEEAIHLAQTERFDLYILDNWLEGMSGIELCTLLREFDSTTPILFFSGAAREQDKRNAIDCGAQGYLVKPSTPDALIVEIRKLIAARANAK